MNKESSGVLELIGNLFLLFFVIAIPIAGIAGYVKSIMWTFEQTEAVNLILGIFGGLVPPVGVIHGLWLFL